MTNFYHNRINYAFIDNQETQLYYISTKYLLIYFHDTAHDYQPENIRHHRLDGFSTYFGYTT